MTAIVERENLGGICLNWGCIPTKALLRRRDQAPDAPPGEFGFSADKVSFDLGKIVKRSRAVAGNYPTASRFLMRKNKITVVRRHAKLAGKGKLDGREGRQAGRRLDREKHRPGDRRAGAHAAGAGAGRQADLDLPRSDGPADLAEIAAGVGSGAIGIEFASFYRTWAPK